MRKTSLAALLATGKPLVLPGVWDALSALLAVRAGFPAVLLSGFCLSATRLGEPDLGILDRADVLDAAARVCAAVDVPVVVDIDTGYGDAAEVARTVRQAARLGAAGVFLEDQVWPKRCGHLDGKRVVSRAEYLRKLAAALDAAREAPAPLHVTARTDARAPLGLDEAIARARAFAEAGADAVFVEAPTSAKELAAVRAAVPRHVPLVANMVEGGRTPLAAVRRLARAGYQIVVVPVAGLLAAAHAVEHVWAALHRNGSTRAAAGRMLSFAALNARLGLEEPVRRARARR